MRTILNLSLPPKTAEIIKKRAKKHGFPSTSGYIRFLLDSDDDLISAEDLLATAKQARKHFRAGKLKKLKSLKNLLKE